jgi:hypothetical protein
MLVPDNDPLMSMNELHEFFLKEQHQSHVDDKVKESLAIELINSEKLTALWKVLFHHNQQEDKSMLSSINNVATITQKLKKQPIEYVLSIMGPDEPAISFSLFSTMLFN